MKEIQKIAFKKYVEIISNAKVNKLTFVGKAHPGYEGHHPLPRAISKLNILQTCEETSYLKNLYTKDEIVFVPCHTHFELHMLLVDMYPKRSQEWFRMSTALTWFIGKRSNKFNVTPEEYETARKNISLSLSARTLGKKQSKEHIEKRTKTLRGRKRTPEQCKANGDARRGKKSSEQARKNQSISGKKAWDTNYSDRKTRQANSLKKYWDKPGSREERGHISKEIQNRPGQREKIRLKLKGVKKSKTAVQHMREVQKIVQNRPDVIEKKRLRNLGKKRSQETCANISAAQKEIHKRPGYTENQIIKRKNVFAIVQFTKEMIFVKRFISIRHASRDTNINRSFITGCCRNQREFAGGFIWKYEKDVENVVQCQNENKN